jgi:hypothetical protein
MKYALLAALAVAVPTVLLPECVVFHDGICFQSQAQYDRYMGWGPDQQTLEINANK